MAEQKTQNLFYRDKPVFGLDIGRSSVKIIQLDNSKEACRVVGYGNTSFDPAAINNGVIVDPEAIVSSTYQLITKGMVGEITTRQVVMSLPNEHCFSRMLTIPKLNSSDIRSAVMNEIESSIPIPVDQLYFDYEASRSLADGSSEILIVAAPKIIVDSYIVVAEALGLEVALIETNITAVTRIVGHAEPTDVVSLIVDFGSTAADLSIFDGKDTRITGTADCGSDMVTDLISKKLGVTIRQAHTIKTKYGLEFSKRQKEIFAAIEEQLSKLISEIKKMQRYYGEHGGDKPIEQIIVLGGGANLPGLSTYITDHIRIPARLCNPWKNIEFGRLQPPGQVETTLYTTCSGLSLVTPEMLKR